MLMDTYANLVRAAEIAELRADTALRCGLRYRALGETSLSEIADRQARNLLTDMRDLRATASDVLALATTAY